LAFSAAALAVCPTTDNPAPSECWIAGAGHLPPHVSKMGIDWLAIKRKNSVKKTMAAMVFHSNMLR